MAKEDFCFTYYDGDAARDMAHMNRLERGAYTDVIISQRKFGHLTLDQIKKILGRDFADCWGAIELIMKTDADGKFFVEWVENSITKMRKHSKKQSENRKGKTKQEPNDNQKLPNINQTQPLEDGNGNGNEDELKNQNGVRENVPREPMSSESKTEVKHDFTKPDVEGDDLVFPIDTGPVRELWARWKQYRWEQYRARYGIYGEQADLKRLHGMNFKQIEQTILAAIANNWKNLYPEKNGNSSAKTKQQRNTESLITGFATRYGSDADSG